MTADSGSHISRQADDAAANVLFTGRSRAHEALVAAEPILTAHVLTTVEEWFSDICLNDLSVSEFGRELPCKGAHA